MTAPAASPLRVFRGARASVHELPRDLPPREGMPEQAATLSMWFVDAPGAHPLWPHYLLSCCHLRDVEGQRRPPHRLFANASHEILLLALNPELGPWTAANAVAVLTGNRTLPRWLSPPNIVHHLPDATDADARTLMALVARAVADGMLPIEVDDYRGGRQHWRTVIASTMQHIRTGGHPSWN